MQLANQHRPLARCRRPMLQGHCGELHETGIWHLATRPGFDRNGQRLGCYGATLAAAVCELLSALEYASVET